MHDEPYDRLSRADRARRRVPREPQLCLECGEEFTASRSDALTCSNACRARRWRRLQWREPRPGFRFRTVEASPDDPMFGRLHAAFISDPGDPTLVQPGRPTAKRLPYKHSPEDPNTPWTIHIDIRPKAED
jgi:hypothetical protein